MHVVIFEPCPRGHRYTYVKRIVNAMQGLPIKLTLATTPGPQGHETWQHQLEPLKHSFNLADNYREEDPTGKFSFAWNTAASFARACRELKPDHVIIPSGDGVVEMIGVRRLMLAPSPSIEAEAMLMSASWSYITRGTLRRWAKRRAWAFTFGASRVGTFHFIDPLVVRSIRALTPGIARRTVLAPDPVEAMPDVSRVEARRRLRIEESGRLISCVGRMDERKGIDLLIRAFMQASLASTDRLLLMGTFMPEIRQILAAEAKPLVDSGRIIVVDGYVSDEQLALAIAAADLVAVTYRRHLGSASILIRAAAQQRPVITSDRGFLGETCARFALGTACHIRDIDTLASALRGALESSDTFTPAPAAARFVEFHSVANAQLFWARRVRERLGLAPSTALRTWDSVLETSLPLPQGEPSP
ncbi:MAG TPA: glycosyltransferase [Phycisphaerales bacterium]